MGSHAHSAIAWGVDFGNPEYDIEEIGGRTPYEGDLDLYDVEQELFPQWFNFTEDNPVRPDGMSYGDWRKKIRYPYETRRDAAIPVTFDLYGYEYSGYVLTVKRSVTKCSQECVPIKYYTLKHPTEDEERALKLVCEKLQYPYNLELLLLSSYG
jgi:hypothetical protein